MRDAFLDELLTEARRDPNIFLIVGDLGYGVVDDFARDLPNQFLNAGVAEQNMVSAAAGLASTGYKVFVYSIANFPTLRALEQIRNDICYHGLDVTIVSVGAGLAYGTLGYTHHAVEDISVLRALPGLRIISPADNWEARASVHESLRHEQPTYIRLGKTGELDLHSYKPSSLAEPIQLRDGDDLTIAGIGAIVNNCLAAADILESAGLSVKVLSCPTVKPLDHSLVTHDKKKLLVTVEEHVLPGGFGSAVLEEASGRGMTSNVHRIGLHAPLLGEIGSTSFLHAAHKLDAGSIAEAVRSRIEPYGGRRSIPT